MAYVTPNSVIQLFQGINLDNRYMHTIYFANENSQNSWFTSKVYKTYQNHSYQRYGVGQIKVKDDATSLMGVTYMRFMNSRTQSKWFYAFVNAVEYINENTALITYEIDVMQTWFIQNGTIRPCLVMREHVNDDSFGSNLEKEPVGSESYTADFITKSTHFENYSVVEFNTNNPLDSQWSVLNPQVYNNDLLVPCLMTATQISDNNSAENFVTGLTTILGGSWDIQQRKAELVDIFTFPTDFCNQSKNANTYGLNVTNPFTFKNYTPKNNKLFTYPYNYLFGTTMNGDSNVYRWEYFDGLYKTSPTVIFHTYGSPVGGGMITCYPDLYDGIDDNHDVALNMSNFPKNAFNIDAYQAWLAAGGKTRLETEETFTKIKGFSAIASASISAFSTGLSGINQTGHNALQLSGTKTSIMDDISGMGRGVNNAVQGAANLVTTSINVAEAMNKVAYKWNDAHYNPNIVVGTSTPNLSVPMRSLNFNFFNVHIKDEEAKRIDDFFSVFGYAINRVKIPNLTGRQYWNFVQTENAVIEGNMPSSSKEAIGRIFDGGITFWHNGDNIGNYRLSVSSDTINNPIV